MNEENESIIKPLVLGIAMAIGAGLGQLFFDNIFMGVVIGFSIGLGLSAASNIIRRRRSKIS